MPAYGGLLLVPKLAGAGLFVIAALLLSGEFTADEIGATRALLRRRPRTGLEASGEL